MHSTFDTLAYAKKLKEAGFTEKQAEVQAEALLEVIEANLASKSDIRELDRKIEESRKGLDHKIEGTRSDLDHKIEETRKDLEQKLEEMGYKLTIRLGGIMVAGITLLAILIKLL